MRTQKYQLAPPSLEELASAITAPLEANYKHSSVSVVTCPDLRQAPFHLATEGLSGDEKAADVGGQPFLYPTPQVDAVWSMIDIAKAMEMDPEKGSIVGAGAGPFKVTGSNCELAPSFCWHHGFENTVNATRYASIDRESGSAVINKSPCLDCALMINLFGSRGERGSVIKVTARGRRGSQKSFTEAIRKALGDVYGEQIISLGGVFLIRGGKTHYHVMQDFPPQEELPFRDFKHLNDWLTYHDFDGPIVCMTLLHSADPGKKLGLRMEHSHGYDPSGRQAGGHYHGDLDGEDVEYEGYFNTANILYRIEQPQITLEHDLHH
ncbi:hypothetical protein F5X68DRAFT_235036 [Plectosphaerella plurivora]|uniref:DUF1907 domain-containing protein n=1 Tax=Plectosphaerella plurivora TaxID=936078 RepID=A0A9P8V587_9PEZI|nr:hypothetical protein F5X68DRAFT_235036 [Plectosphaerella plurivora]